MDGLLQALIFGTAAGEGDLVHGAGLFGHDEAPLGHGQLNACRDLVHGLALAYQGDDLGLGENRALGGNGNDVLRLQGQVGEFGQIHFEGLCHGLKEPARTGGALVVHGKVQHGTVGVHGDALHVLAADIDNGPNAGVHHVDAHGVTADLGNVLVCCGHLVPAIAGAHQVAQVPIGAKLLYLGCRLIQSVLTAEDRVDPAAQGDIRHHLAGLI